SFPTRRSSDLGDPARLLLQGAELLFVGSSLELLAKQRRDAGDGGDRIVQLVRHSGAQRAERGEAPGAEDLILRLLELGGPLVDALLKLAVPAADLLVAPHDLARHLVERARQLADLVVAVHLRGLGTAEPERLHAFAQPVDRLGDATG